MWATIFMAILPMLLKLVGWGVDSVSNNSQTKQAFIELVSRLEYGGMRSVKLRESYRGQIDRRKHNISQE